VAQIVIGDKLQKFWDGHLLAVRLSALQIWPMDEYTTSQLAPA